VCVSHTHTHTHKTYTQKNMLHNPCWLINRLNALYCIFCVCVCVLAGTNCVQTDFYAQHSKCNYDDYNYPLMILLLTPTQHIGTKKSVLLWKWIAVIAIIFLPFISLFIKQKTPRKAIDLYYCNYVSRHTEVAVFISIVLYIRVKRIILKTYKPGSVQRFLIGWRLI